MSNELKSICVSLETAKKLVEAGIVIESVFSWFYFDEIVGTKGIQKLPVQWLIKDWTRKNEEEGKCYPAPTAEEIVVVMPESLNIKGWDKPLKMERSDGKYHCFYDIYGEVLHNDKLCEALAQMLPWLKQEGYLKEVK